MNVYEATKEVRKFILNSVDENIVQTNGVVGYYQGEIIKFRSKQEASILDGGNGYLFEYIYRNGQVEITPIM